MSVRRGGDLPDDEVAAVQLAERLGLHLLHCRGLRRVLLVVAYIKRTQEKHKPPSGKRSRQGLKTN